MWKTFVQWVKAKAAWIAGGLVALGGAITLSRLRKARKARFEKRDLELNTEKQESITVAVNQQIESEHKVEEIEELEARIEEVIKNDPDKNMSIDDIAKLWNERVRDNLNK